MTIIAYDGKTLAADKQSTCCGLAVTTTKIRRVTGGAVAAYTGDQDSGEVLLQWYDDGADPELWPAVQQAGKGWARLVVADAQGCRFYDRRPIAVEVEDSFAAWGSGRDFAVAALHCGKTAVEAVEIASLYSVDCGKGIDAFDLT